ncbi:TetR/AcrR family transcriptional regulator [Tateyamaria omphalii]|uniref:TetR/AcrR family transcriptional regulator n=1 Tax=Tateyamaria omphalii TaxID=299262 RepID=UPI001C997BD1|nr:TetR/AcrR family transcriptional regulator [Tateyamaria omphalii]MBY5935195.1 TetR/AcrR family transcriptional regulator [Tateyamaria omphalii]
MVRTIAKDHDDKRRHILKVAAEVFAREGIARASMNEVARACGISKANIYHYYSSKDDLIFDILDSYLSELRDWICDLSLDALSPAEQLRAVTREFLLAYDGMDHQHKIQGEGLPLLPEDKQTILKGYQRDLVAVVSRILQGCAPETLGQDRAQCRDVTMSVFGMLNWFYMWQPKATKDARIAYAGSIADLTLNGITTKT